MNDRNRWIDLESIGGEEARISERKRLVSPCSIGSDTQKVESTKNVSLGQQQVGTRVLKSLVV